MSIRDTDVFHVSLTYLAEYYFLALKKASTQLFHLEKIFSSGYTEIFLNRSLHFNLEALMKPDPICLTWPRVFSTISSPCSLQMSLALTLFWKYALYLNSFRQLVRKSKFLPVSFGPWLFLARNNPVPKRHSEV